MTIERKNQRNPAQQFFVMIKRKLKCSFLKRKPAPIEHTHPFKLCLPHQRLSGLALCCIPVSLFLPLPNHHILDCHPGVSCITVNRTEGRTNAACAKPDHYIHSSPEKKVEAVILKCTKEFGWSFTG
ncbi:hypothetical protein AMECASPLE_036919 [Ameca splendens]|uniref:Uncharacterized protein n=1 Tax=Ameca splendens TaxID=208324 RepID=A0ABV0YK32_9TELE